MVLRFYGPKIYLMLQIISVHLFRDIVLLEARKPALWRGSNRLILGVPPTPRAYGQIMTSLDGLLYIFGGYSASGNIRIFLDFFFKWKQV